jgi:hypothetical protein
MAKGRGGRKREVKKPKGGNKPVQSGSASLPSQPAVAKPPEKESGR